MPHNGLKRVLYIEDDVGLARLMQRRMAVKNLEVDIAPTGLDGLVKLKSGSYDLILLDNFLPDMNGIDLLDQIQPLDQQPPVILLTAGGDERLAVTALEKGAADYAVKDVDQFYIELLPAIMQAAYTRYRLMNENKQQREDLEKAWQRAEAANRAKSEFLATMSHEIRTPLNVILGISSLLEKTRLDDKQREMMGVLHTNASVLLGLVNDVLDLSRIESGQMVLETMHFNIKQVLDNIHAMFAMDAAKKGLEFKIDDQVGNIEWEGDSLRVQQIVMNLISNAIKFTPEGFIHVIARLLDDDTVRISVQDSGIGISADKLEAIFSKFVQADQSITRRFGGSGLGLSLAQSFANMMDGQVEVESEVGKGSTFHVTLKLQRSQEQAAQGAGYPEPAGEALAQMTGERVLLVEDYPANIMIATMMLEDLNYRVDVVSSGQEAVDKVVGAAEPYHAIIMDIQMHGMDGFEATRRIRAHEGDAGNDNNRRNFIIGATAHALAGDRERCLEAGMDDYISKPIDWTLMDKKLRR